MGLYERRNEYVPMHAEAAQVRNIVKEWESRRPDYALNVADEVRGNVGLTHHRTPAVPVNRSDTCDEEYSDNSIGLRTRFERAR